MKTIKIKFYIRFTMAIVIGLAMAACDNPQGPNNSQEEPDIPEELSVAEATEADGHGSFVVSNGIYRIPYEDGESIFVNNNHHTHSPVDRYDIHGAEGTPIVAAASGWIRGIVDNHGESPNPGDGLAADGTTPQDDSLEHDCLDDSNVTGQCQDHNNYVWIEHPNGEWTQYTHLGTGTVTIDYGWQVGDWINVGEVIGLENSIGFSSNSHLHFEAARPDIPGVALTWDLNGGFFQNGFNILPRICSIDNNTGDIENDLMLDNETYTATACDHDPPVADAGGPYEVDEGTSLMLDGTGSSDPEGLSLTYLWEPESDANTDPWFLDDHSLAQPTFVAGTDMQVNLTLTVYDQIEALDDADNTMVTVNNVAPTVTIDPNQVSVIDEEGTVSIEVEFTDPGWLDTHTASINWGVPAGHEGNELAPADIQILNSGGPDDPLVGRVSGTYQYGDNDDGSGFTITVTVTDSDGDQGSDSFSLTVNNVDPTVSIDLGGTVLLNGEPTVVANVGDEIDFNGQSEDSGSDDLTLSWDWDDGTSDSRISLVNPPDADPLPSPTVQPRIEPDQVFHEFTEACLYEVTFSATDDDDGHADETVDVIIAGLADQARGAGYWTSEYRMIKNPDLTPATLECYLDIVNHASMVFSEQRMLASIDDAVDILWTRGKKTEDEIFDRQLLAAWLNVANGAYALNQMVDTTGDDLPDIPYQQVLEDAETLRTDPTRTPETVLAMKDLLEELNTADD